MQTVKPDPVDWTQLQNQIGELARPTIVTGSIQHRDQATTGGELWDLSLAQDLALEEANGDKVRMANHVQTFIDKMKEQNEKRSWWKFWSR